MVFLSRLQDMATLIDTDMASCKDSQKKHRAFVRTVSSKLDNLAFAFLLGPFVFNQTASYSYYVEILCEILCSIEVHKEYFHNTSKEKISEKNVDFFFDLSHLIKTLCTEIHSAPEIMSIAQDTVADDHDDT